MYRDDDPINKYDEKWHRRVDQALFGKYDDNTGIWVDGLLQSNADLKDILKRTGTLVARVGLPLLAIIALATIATAFHSPPIFMRNILTLFGIH